jgi:hypothetical protein
MWRRPWFGALRGNTDPLFRQTASTRRGGGIGFNSVSHQLRALHARRSGALELGEGGDASLRHLRRPSRASRDPLAPGTPVAMTSPLCACSPCSGGCW